MNPTEAPLPQPSEAQFLGWSEGVRLAAARLAGRAATHPLTAACGEAMADWLGEPDAQALLRDLFRANPTLAVDEVQRKIRAAAQYELLDKPGFPHAYTTEHIWTQKLREADPKLLGDRIVNWDLGTEVPQRYVIGAFLLSVLRHRLSGGDLEIVDIGCSKLAGAARLVLAGEVPGFGFDPVDVIELTPARQVMVMAGKGPRFNAAAAAAPRVGRLMGVDRASQDARWLRACLLPDEIAAGQAEQNDRLAAAGARDPRIRFVHADITQHQGQRAVRATIGHRRRVDAVMAIASWRQGSQRERLIKSSYMEGLGRLAIIADFVDEQKGRLQPEDTWTDMNVFVIYKSHIYKVMRFTDGRCRQVEILPQLAELAEDGPYERTVAGLVSKRAINQAALRQAARLPAGCTAP